jgi:uncharacterized protein
MHIIIDGYNLIRQSKTLSAIELEDIQRGREALIDMLSVYKNVKHHRITVVFDGANAPFLSPAQDRVKGIKVVFSRNDETADSVIKRMAVNEGQQALIVSSDREIFDFAVQQGAATLASPDFEKKMTASLYGEVGDIDHENDRTRVWDGSTKKKGPSKRRSKKDRYRQTKIKKL